MEYEPVIGLEVHLQLKTATKIFCGCANEFGSAPNTRTCPVCLGLPGSLPVLNKQALLYAMKVGLALDCEINSYLKFDRKNYYYPDLPKGYQISQFDMPLASNGHLDIVSNGAAKRVTIKRAHMEEDAGKLIHDNQVNASLVDYNRTGTPLIEIVTGPDMHSPQEAYDYLTLLKLTLEYLNVSDCDMEKGSLRCDANVSIRPKGETKLGTKTELKNMNSFRAVKTALEFEIERHKQVISSGGKITQETLLWNEEKQRTISMRSKEEAHDYRYFPDPDLVPFTIAQEAIDEVKKSMPELPMAKKERLIAKGVTVYDAGILVSDVQLAAFFEECSASYGETKKICNWISSILLKELNERKLTLKELKLNPQEFVGLIQKVEDGTLSNLAGKDVLKYMIETGKPLETVISEKGFTQVSDDGELEKVLDEILAQNPHVLEQIRQGKQNAAGFIIGQAMKKMQGKANPKKLGELINRRV